MTAPTYSITEDGRAIHCLMCGRTSFNLSDVANRYCGHCHVFHEDLAVAEQLRARSNDKALETKS